MTDSRDKKQLKFIEILLVVGGIIGGLGYKSENSLVRTILALFLISSLLYYSAVYNQEKGRIPAFFTSVLFPVLITYPLISGTPPISFWGGGRKILGYIIAAGLFYVIFGILQEKSGLVKLKYRMYIIGIGIFLTVLFLYGLDHIPASG
jgi:hypothetical protein